MVQKCPRSKVLLSLLWNTVRYKAICTDHLPTGGQLDWAVEDIGATGTLKINQGELGPVS